MKYTTILVALCLAFSLSGCIEPKEPTAKQTQSQKALAAAESSSFAENAEIQSELFAVLISIDKVYYGCIADHIDMTGGYNIHHRLQ